MTLRIADLLDSMDQRAPFSAAAVWDPVGLQLGSRQRSVGRIGVTHELTDATVATVVDAKFSTVVTYHPLVFRPLGSVTEVPGAEGRVLALAEAGVAVVAIHTNWDVADGGTADCLAAALGLTEPSGFAPARQTDEDDEDGQADVADEDGQAGVADVAGWAGHIGRVGRFDGDGAELVAGVDAALGGIRRSTRLDDVGLVAVLPGSGGSFVDAAVAAGAGVLVTGDVSHHQARSALDAGMGVIDPGHIATERPGVRALYSAVSELVDDAVDLTDLEVSPWEGR